MSMHLVDRPHGTGYRATERCPRTKNVNVAYIPKLRLHNSYTQLAILFGAHNSR